MARKRFLTEANRRRIHGFLRSYLLEVFFCGENEFTPEERSIEEIYRMIAGGFAFFPVNEGTRASEIKNYIEMGFKVAFLRAGDFKRFRKDYKDFM